MNNLVQFNEEHNCGTTTSLKIAEKFNRQHKTVLAAINDLEIPQEFIEQNFLPYSYIAKNGKANPAYEITFDGFTLLAMGFTGKKAMEFKVKYIKAFRAMEAELRKRQDKPVIVSEHTRSLPSGKKEIVLSAKAREEIGGIVKSVLQAEIRERENIRDVLREVIRDEVADWFLKDGIEEGTFNTSPTADGLPAVNWVVGISHGATALYNLIQQYQKCLREKNDLLLSENADLKNRMKQISSWVR